MRSCGTSRTLLRGVASVVVIRPPVVAPSRASSCSLGSPCGEPRRAGQDAGLRMSAINFQYVHSFICELLSCLTAGHDAFAKQRSAPRRERFLRYAGWLTPPDKLRLYSTVSAPHECGTTRRGLWSRDPAQSEEFSSFARADEQPLASSVVRHLRVPSSGMASEDQEPRESVRPSSTLSSRDPRHLPPVGTRQAGRYPFSGRCDLWWRSLARLPPPGRSRRWLRSAARSLRRSSSPEASRFDP